MQFSLKQLDFSANCFAGSKLYYFLDGRALFDLFDHMKLRVAFVHISDYSGDPMCFFTSAEFQGLVYRLNLFTYYFHPYFISC